MGREPINMWPYLCRFVTHFPDFAHLEVFHNALSGGPIIGLRLHGLGPIFKGGLRISTWFFYGLRLQQKVRLASFSVNSQRFTASMLRLRLSAEIKICGKGLQFTPKCTEKSSTSNRSNVRMDKLLSVKGCQSGQEKEREEM